MSGGMLLIFPRASLFLCEHAILQLETIKGTQSWTRIVEYLSGQLAGKLFFYN